MIFKTIMEIIIIYSISIILTILFPESVNNHNTTIITISIAAILTIRNLYVSLFKQINNELRKVKKLNKEITSVITNYIFYITLTSFCIYMLITFAFNINIDDRLLLNILNNIIAFNFITSLINLFLMINKLVIKKSDESRKEKGE